MFIDAQKTERMLAFLEDEHFRHRRVADAVPSANEIDLSAGWSLMVDARSSALLTHMRDDFRTFMSRCMDTDLADGGLGRQIVFKLLRGDSSKDECFKITASDDVVEVTSVGERGLLHASHYMERQFALRGGPFLKKETIERSPVFDIRISNTVFCEANGRIDGPIIFTDKYLGLMSHFGVNGVHMYISIWDYCRNSSLPELNSRDYELNVDRLRNLCMRLAERGIDVYPTIRNLPVDASVFEKHRSARGATVNYPGTDRRHCVCSSDPDVIACYSESFANLFKMIPELGGVTMIVGGEGFVHCFTRPTPPFEGNTDCPNCSGRNPSVDVAALMNGIASSIHSVSPDAKVFTWPYSAFTWSAEDSAQTEFISRLNDDVQLLSNFNTPGEFTLNGRSAALLDYNILDLGPSEQFETQSKVLEKQGKSHYAKIEGCIEAGWFSLPYLPLHYRWIERMKRLKQHKVAGLLARWRFYGFTDCIPEELICAATWGEDTEPERMLLDIAHRDFGEVDDRMLLQGWERLSSVWDKVPSGHMIWGERDFYMKGPVYLGPAHPLIFDAQKKYDLIKKFYTLTGDFSEHCTEEELLEMAKNASPRFSSDLLFTYPFGAEAVEEAFLSASDEWEAATNQIAEAIGPNPNERAKMELNICRMMGAHLRTTWNVVRFYRERDALFNQGGDEAAWGAQIDRLSAIADDEIENATRALTILENDVRIGYGYCYGQIYDADMVSDKIRQCNYVRDIELPGIKSGVLFHVYQKFE